jgi:hypothetical protein
MIASILMLRLALVGVQVRESFSWSFDITDNSLKAEVAASRWLPTFGEWSVVVFADHPGVFLPYSGFSTVISKESQNSVLRIKSLLDTDDASRILKECFHGEDQTVYGFAPAVAAAYLSNVRDFAWAQTHARCISSARTILSEASLLKSGETFGLKQGIACIALAKISSNSTERTSLYMRVIDSATGETEALGLSAFLEICKQKADDGKFDDVQKLAVSGLTSYKKLESFANYWILLHMKRDPHIGSQYSPAYWYL